MGSISLDTESSQFERGKVPHIWIQWKGTNVCCDIHCLCGAHLHFDGDFMYFIQCPHCQQHWEIGSHVPMYPVSKDTAEAGCLQYPDRDENYGR